MLILLRNLLFLIAMGVASVAMAEPEPAMFSRMLPGKTLKEATRDLVAAISGNNYSFVREQAIDSRLVPLGLEAKRLHIVYFCNLAKMSRALAIDVRAAQFMPCRVTLLETGQGVELLVVNPAWLSQGMGNPLLHQDCLELKRDYLAILDEASL